MKPGDRVALYYLPRPDDLPPTEENEQPDIMEILNTFTVVQGVVVEDNDPHNSMGGDYEADLCVRLDGETEYRRFQKGDDFAMYGEAYYGGYTSTAVIVAI